MGSVHRALEVHAVRVVALDHVEEGGEDVGVEELSRFITNENYTINNVQ